VFEGGPRERSRCSDSLRVGRSGMGFRGGGGGSRFSAPVQTGSGAHLASYTIDTGSFRGVKRPGRSVDHPLPSNTEVKERVELYLYSTPGPSWPVIGWTLPFYLRFEDHYFAHCPPTCPTIQIARLRSGERGGHSLLIIILSRETLCKESVIVFAVWTVTLFCWK